VARRKAAGVDVEVLYHPSHGANVERILEAASRTLEYGVRGFGPYPFPELRIVEIPSYWKRFAGLAMPGLVFLVEDRGFLTDTRDASRVDVVSKRIAHEVAHQWWGHELSPPSLPGATVLVESLARYSELMMLKELHGRDALAPVLSTELTTRSPRSSRRARPPAPPPRPTTSSRASGPSRPRPIARASTSGSRRSCSTTCASSRRALRLSATGATASRPASRPRNRRGETTARSRS
jgi:aminopeptidase N